MSMLVEETISTRQKTRQQGDVTEQLVLTTMSSKNKSAPPTGAILYGKDLSEYDSMNIEELLEKLTPSEIDILAREVDPDDALLPPDQRTSYLCEKDPSGPLNRKQLIEHINKQAIEEPDRPEAVPYQKGVVRGKRYIEPERPITKQEEEIAIDLGDEYEKALGKASEEELVDLAAVLGFHSMMNQEQYHASLLNKDKVGLGWGGVTKATKYKPLPNEPDNQTNIDKTIEQVATNDSSLKELIWNNIKNVPDEKIARLFDGLKNNTQLEKLALANTCMYDRHCPKLIEALQKNTTLRVLNVDSNYISAAVIRDIIKALNVNKTLEEFRAANQNYSALGNKIEMEITQLLEQNPTLLRLGLFFEFNDARNRIATHLQSNCDKLRKKRIGAL